MGKTNGRTPSVGAVERKSRGRRRGDASFPAAPARADLPEGYAVVLGEIKRRIGAERLRVVMAANSAMVLLYWDIGRLILERQEREGWGAKVIDRLSADLREAYPDMSGLSPRNLKYMRAFAAAWRDLAIVQRPLAQITWYHNITLLERVSDPGSRLWYARKIAQEGWSQSVLCSQIESQVHERQGQAVNNFALTLPPADSDMAAQVFKDP
jgi:predicted nuclease of restriction endonuclease-like (RecB) superfamily